MAKGLCPPFDLETYRAAIQRPREAAEPASASEGKINPEGSTSGTTNMEPSRLTTVGAGTSGNLIPTQPSDGGGGLAAGTAAGGDNDG